MTYEKHLKCRVKTLWTMTASVWGNTCVEDVERCKTGADRRKLIIAKRQLFAACTALKELHEDLSKEIP